MDKSLVHKLTGSMKELFRSGEGESTVCCQNIAELSSFSAAYGNSMRACAEDLIKFGTTISTTESILGRPASSSVAVPDLIELTIYVHAKHIGWAWKEVMITCYLVFLWV